MSVNFSLMLCVLMIDSLWPDKGKCFFMGKRSFAMPDGSGIHVGETGGIAGEAKVPFMPKEAARRLHVGPEKSESFRAPVDFDLYLHAWQSRLTGGLSPGIFALSFFDWFLHAANSPFRMASIAGQGFLQTQKWMRIALNIEKPVAPKPADYRFVYPGWGRRPFDLLVQATLLGEDWINKAVVAPYGVQQSSESFMVFCARQWMNALSPSNFPWLNPEIIDRTFAEGGRNLSRGFLLFLEDMAARQKGKHAQAYKVGVDIAVTPGKVVYRNKLIELIQYAPSTPLVEAEPVLIVPAWIMKYYILDLSPHNSLIRWLVSKGRTVFCISWRNPGADMRDMTFEDYRKLGIVSALDVVGALGGGEKIHAVGYCLGGTLLAVQAALMAREEDDRLASLSLLAAETDYSDAGELQLFISEDQLSFLNDMMQAQGFLSSEQMEGAFQLLRANDLIWLPSMRKYWLGERGTMNDLMAWNADGTRMPAKMHIHYLRHFFLSDDLAEGRYVVDGDTVALRDIRLPIFIVGTERDHIAPWRSVFKLHYLSDSEITFVLTSGGHNAGIVSEPGHKGRSFRIRSRPAEGRTFGPDEWLNRTEPQKGSWWPAWENWIDAHSSGPRLPPPSMGSGRFKPLCDAPGVYVFET